MGEVVDVRDDAKRVLRMLVEAARASVSAGTEPDGAQKERWSGFELTSGLGLSPERLNAAVPYLEQRSAVHVMRAWNSLPYDFLLVSLAPLGQSVYQDIKAADAQAAEHSTAKARAKRALNNPWVVGAVTGAAFLIAGILVTR